MNATRIAFGAYLGMISMRRIRHPHHGPLSIDADVHRVSHNLAWTHVVVGVQIAIQADAQTRVDVMGYKVLHRRDLSFDREGI